jgi:hypothetical protein
MKAEPWAGCLPSPLPWWDSQYWLSAHSLKSKIFNLKSPLFRPCLSGTAIPLHRAQPWYGDVS